MRSAGLGEPRAASAEEARQDRRRVKELERELHCKDKALAETAALLVLSKNPRESESSRLGMTFGTFSATSLSSGSSLFCDTS